jgi:hypothetical protein
MNAPANPGQFQRVQRGPQIGAPLSLEQVPLDRLQVDPAYQRATDGTQSRRIINSMIKQWDWSLCQPLAVSRRGDGGLYVLDGQHRLEGARARGDIFFLPCVINAGLDLAGEARTFVKINTERQKLSDSDVFLGMLAAGDFDAVSVQSIMEATGWALARTKNTAVWKPGQLICGPMLVRMLKLRGEHAVRFALSTLRAAYPETPVTVTATLLAALGEIFDGEHMAGLSTATLAKAIGAVEPRRWRIRAAKRRELFGGESEQTALAQCMIAAAKGQGEAAFGAPATDAPGLRPPPAAPIAPPAPAVARQRQPAPRGADPFGTRGKGWCEQCEQLRSRELAASCISRFCKLRGVA